MPDEHAKTHMVEYDDQGCGRVVPIPTFYVKDYDPQADLVFQFATQDADLAKCCMMVGKTVSKTQIEPSFGGKAIPLLPQDKTERDEKRWVDFLANKP